ncbi:hypothetical protein EMIHUDRAFT_61494 [Emiliania huxleyi CCMP1516]|uniref:G domain-containing protein n=2 Tax=Emiliania huxleyi TaxID=2903 RepID=A0A0D3J4E3_EMIH1|nr:hypothetical protein EMIHUDRAFT_61494 [Emiliania huxleyi CCMP1516]EOD18378.1 hypothetical protein EMIHUDRAFT_61494 [Emiliania huxleyi CCMP1516]|eukprot:XP_005770807.1 hypothetical protein EMIHUDRAFT_61494 [Emiliania huxleyi CCMP1516]
MDPAELDEAERSAFLAWRRGLATLEEEGGECLTPYEKNLEVWRQLWRVLERSQLARVVQIVDARNPLLFRSVDLERSAGEASPPRPCVLLADLLSAEQRAAWADYFRAHGIEALFWSAARAQQEIDANARGASTARVGSRVLRREELLRLLLARCPDGPPGPDGAPRRCVGLVGYPNVGKSSTVNAMVAAKKTNVSATPGKTKPFQTLLVLCDCPGLVFPSVAGSKAQMICDGILPIDQMRDYMPPLRLLCGRLGPDDFFQTYGVRLRTPEQRLDDPDAPEQARELLIALALARGFMTATKGGPDESRAARIVLKDLVNAKLLHCAPPPGAASSRGGGGGGGGGGGRVRKEPAAPTAERWLSKVRADYEAQEGRGGHFAGRRGAGTKGAPRGVQFRPEGALPDRLVARGPRGPAFA